MKNRGRLDRLVRGIDQLEPEVDVVTEAMAEFRRIGRLPRDAKTAWAVTQWAETGEPPGRDGDSLLERLCLHVQVQKPSPPPRDVVMQGLYEDAVFGDALEQLLARMMLALLAKAELDPSKAVWTQLGWEVPAMTCNSMAMAILGFPGAFVRPEHRRRTLALADKVRAVVDGRIANQRQRDSLLAAAEAFFDSGQLPPDPKLADAILWNAEASAYCQTWLTGDDYSRQIEAFRVYWRATSSDRPAALVEVRAAVRAGPGPESAGHPGLWSRLKRLLVPFVTKVMDTAEQMA